MAKLSEYGVKTNELPDGASYDPIPAGWYTVSITEVEVKDTKENNGRYLHMRYDVVGPTCAGRIVYGNINIRNASAKAQEIGLQQLATLLESIGFKGQDPDTSELIGHQLQIKVTVRQEEGFEPQNDVRGYKAVTGSPAPAPATAPAWAARKTTSAPASAPAFAPAPASASTSAPAEIPPSPTTAPAPSAAPWDSYLKRNAK